MERDRWRWRWRWRWREREMERWRWSEGRVKGDLENVVLGRFRDY
jgi:hypothetical protein